MAHLCYTIVDSFHHSLLIQEEPLESSAPGSNDLLNKPY